MKKKSIPEKDNPKMPAAYDPKEAEDKIYRLWEKSGYFNPDNLPASKIQNSKFKIQNFTIIMPPPNANGALHIGHAVFVVLQDIMIRYKRMRGYKTLWLPGADHAGFETQVVYDKKLEKEGRSRFQIPREKLYEEMLAFTLNNKKIMEDQLRKLGASCDWSREKFTLDKDIIKIVYKTFEKLYKDSLCYRGERIVNWCTKHQTALSELETIHIERKDPLYYIKYGPLTLATVRPETKFGDTAVAVNPKDARHKNYIGKEIEINTLIGKAKIKVIADDAVDIDFGTGVIKVTPAHDPNDFEIGKRHGLEVREVIDKFGRLNEKTGKYAGLKVMEARKIVAEDMQKAGLLVKVDEKYEHAVATCYKCGTILEPRVMPQWFIRVATKPKGGKKSLHDMAVESVKSEKVKFVTKRFEKIFFHWMKNIHDWNISRQIVWGIPIPAKYCKECNEIVVDIEDKIRKCPECSTSSLEKDPDTFDTWFSSGQWPFAVLLSQNRSKSKFKIQNSKVRSIFNFTTRDFQEFYPTQIMETAHDILFFWVARMMMLGIYATGKPPFKNVYLHGLVRAQDRQKMSKSKGNVIDPLGVTEIYGTDALRMALVVGNTPGSDIIISEEKIRGYKHFANKIWNAARFVLQAQNEKSKVKSQKSKLQFKIQNLTNQDKKTLRELKNFTEEVTRDMENFKFYLAADKIYHYFWHTFADKIIEEAKPRLNGKDEKDKLSAQYALLEILKTNLKFLHPFMPFVTEKIWSLMLNKKTGKKNRRNLLMIESWPT